MSAAKIAITIDLKLLKALDRVVSKGRYSNRSQAISHAVREQMERMNKTRLLKELALLDKKEERDLADEFVSSETEWSKY